MPIAGVTLGEGRALNWCYIFSRPQRKRREGEGVAVSLPPEWQRGKSVEVLGMDEGNVLGMKTLGRLECWGFFGMGKLALAKVSDLLRK